MLLPMMTIRSAGVVPPMVLFWAPELMMIPSKHPRIVAPLSTFPLDVISKQGISGKLNPKMMVPGPPPSNVSFPVDRGGRVAVRTTKPPPGITGTMVSAEAAPGVPVTCSASVPSRVPTLKTPVARRIASRRVMTPSRLFVSPGELTTIVAVGAGGSRSWTKMSLVALVSPATRLVARESKATKRPSPLMVARALKKSPWLPALSTLTLSVVPVWRSRTKMSKTPLVSPATRLVASESKAMKRTSSLMALEKL